MGQGRTRARRNEPLTGGESTILRVADAQNATPVTQDAAMTNQPFDEAAWACGTCTVSTLTQPNGNSRSRLTLSQAATRYLGVGGEHCRKTRKSSDCARLYLYTRERYWKCRRCAHAWPESALRLIGAAASRVIPALCQTIRGPHSLDTSNNTQPFVNGRDRSNANFAYIYLPVAYSTSFASSSHALSSTPTTQLLWQEYSLSKPK